jgi:hypothetical protein
MYWYEQQCNGQWEHEFGVRVESIDNPGWEIEINLTGTKLEHMNFEEDTFEESTSNWYHCRKDNSNFEAACSPQNLLKVINIFMRWEKNC